MTGMELNAIAGAGAPDNPCRGDGYVTVVRRESTRVVGVLTEAAFGDLATLIPAAWRLLFARVDQLRPSVSYVEVSRHLGAGRYREIVGAITEDDAAVPDGMTNVLLPAGAYLHIVHSGPTTAIGDSFQAMYDYADEHGVPVGYLKLDIGYTTGTDGPHDLFMDIPGGNGLS
jgi:predicted transcriptional regulator YdeE